MNIYIPIEVKARELEGRTLLALSAAERGHTVLLGSKDDTLVPALHGKLPAGILHHKSLTPSDQMLSELDRLTSNGIVVTSQDEESGLLDQSYEKFARIRYGEASLQKAGAVFGWGQHDTDSLKRHYPGHADKFIATGSPRVDFWRSEFSGYFELDEKLRTWKGKPYILFVSNFGTVIRENKIWNVMARLREARYFERDPDMELFEYEYSGYILQLIGHFVKMIRAVAVRYPDVQILVRPHPTEALDAWDKMIGPYPNVHVFREGTVSAWVRGAKAIIHNGCTTALEAAAAGIPRLAYRPIPNERFEREIPNSISQQLFSLEDMLDAVGDVVKGQTDPEPASRNLHDRLCNLEGDWAADRMVSVWEKLAIEHNLPQHSPDEITNLVNGAVSTKNTSRSVLPMVRQAARKVTGNPIVTRPISMVSRWLGSQGATQEKDAPQPLLDNSFKFKSYTDDEFTSILGNLQRSTGRFKKVQWKRHSDRSMIIWTE